VGRAHGFGAMMLKESRTDRVARSGDREIDERWVPSAGKADGLHGQGQRSDAYGAAGCWGFRRAI